MKHRALDSFWNRYRSLPREIQTRADLQFELLKSDPRHPSLHWKKIGMSRGGELWSVRVTLRYRALAIRRLDDFLWFWIGNHDDYDQLISSP